MDSIKLRNRTKVIPLDGFGKAMPGKEMDTNTNDEIEVSISVNGNLFFTCSKTLNTVEDLQQFKAGICKYIDSMKLAHVAGFTPL